MSAVLPASLPPSEATQTLSVAGQNFKPGLSVEFTLTPNGGVAPASVETTTLSGSAIQNLTDTSFQVVVSVREAGTYDLRVINPASAPSDPVTVVAQPSQTSRPSVAGITPGSPLQAPAPQPVYVAGTNFDAGLAVVLTGPDGGTSTIDGAAIVFGSPTVFRMMAALVDAGVYRLRVRNPSGDTSEPLTFTVRAVEPPRDPDPTPTVTGLSPASPTISSLAQTIHVAGAAFAPGLTVAITAPGGAQTTISGGAIQSVTASMFQMTVTFTQAGNYSLKVTNPSGQSSNAWPFIVRAPETAQPPVITGLTPGSPMQKNEAQPLYVVGTGFQPALTVELTAPDGSTSSVGGSMITFGSSTVFNMRVVLAVVGTYNFKVQNPSGPASNVWTFVVRPLETPMPVVTGMSPSVPTVNPSSQTVGVAGGSFAAGLTVVVTGPDGAAIGGATAQNVTSTSFQLSLLLAHVGAYSLRVTNPSGQTSAPWSFNVKAPETAVPPTITSISPTSPVRSTAVQPVYVFGDHFQSGLQVTLTLPNGTTTDVGGSAITFGSFTVFQMRVLLVDAGNYSFRVTNPNGLSSDGFALVVRNP